MEILAQLIVDARATLGEGPVWDAERRCLFWVDIVEGKLHVHELDGPPDLAIEVGGMLGAAVMRVSGGMLLATDTGLYAWHAETGQKQLLANPEADRPENRFNDGKCDPAGRFWVGSMRIDAQGTAGALYVLDVDHSIRCVRTGIGISNGLDWSPDGRIMYFIDTPTREVRALDFDCDRGELGEERIAVRFPEGVGFPDGMTVDEQGMLWIAHWNGGRVTRWDPTRGRLLATIRLPVDRVTSCAFGGEHLDRLFITTDGRGEGEGGRSVQPGAGGLFVARPGVRGLPAHPFRG